MVYLKEAFLLYFAYTARISPDEMANVSPGAEFQFIAHLPQWGLDFPMKNGTWGGGLPTVKPEEGSTVWGAVFDVPEDEYEELDAVETSEKRTATTVEAMDRTGKRHQVTVHLHEGRRNGTYDPSAEYVQLMLSGSKHWSLPAGWIAGLEEHLRNGH
ncbi:MAG: gamma-glutamylcyclotransferase [Acidimicrobiia bacterium]|nr:gamma-glutamylcyclotransferase [Acidimicrobiia bacterium]